MWSMPHLVLGPSSLLTSAKFNSSGLFPEIDVVVRPLALRFILRMF